MKQLIIIISICLFCLGLAYTYLLHISPSEKILESNEAVNGIGLYWHGYKKRDSFGHAFWAKTDLRNPIHIIYESYLNFPYFTKARSLYLSPVDSLQVIDIIKTNEGQIISEWDFNPETKTYLFKIRNKKNEEIYSTYNTKDHRLGFFHYVK